VILTRSGSMSGANQGIIKICMAGGGLNTARRGWGGILCAWFVWQMGRLYRQT